MACSAGLLLHNSRPLPRAGSAPIGLDPPKSVITQDMLTSQSHGGKSLCKVLSSQVPLVCTKLTKTNQHNCYCTQTGKPRHRSHSETGLLNATIIVSSSADPWVSVLENGILGSTGRSSAPLTHKGKGQGQVRVRSVSGQGQVRVRFPSQLCTGLALLKRGA